MPQVSHLQSGSHAYLLCAMDLMFGSPPYSYVEILPLKVMLLGSEAFRLAPEGGALVNGTSALITEGHESSFTHSAIWGHREKTPPMNQEAGVHQICQHPHLPSFQNCQKKVLLFISYPADEDTPYPALYFNILSAEG